MEHKSVLLNETVDGLDIKDNDVVVDMTLGGGGHTEAVLKTGAKNLTIIGIDADEDAIKRAEDRVKKYVSENKNSEASQIKLIFETIYFDSLEEVLVKHNIKKINKVIFDLGYSSFEIESEERGFSFLKDGPLEMTYSKNPSKKQLTAYDVVNSFSEENLADIIFGFGEEKFSRRIARAIVETRERDEIKNTSELAEIISESVPKFYQHYKNGGRSKIHPATKTFQAIRITVNSELERLKIALKQSFQHLEKDGRIAVISFHSLEDRIVKRFFKQKTTDGEAMLVNKKIITPTESEIKNNPRSRSAKLRIIMKTK